VKTFLAVLVLCVSVMAQAVKPQSATLSQQKMCADQAKKVFHDDSPLRPSFLEWDYTSHYDTKSNRCFIMTAFIDLTATVFNVSDAFELRSYATYEGLNTRKPGEATIFDLLDCEVNRPGHETEKCKSSEEFFSFTDKYFGIGR
jgi:hypothetical protein